MSEPNPINELMDAINAMCPTDDPLELQVRELVTNLQNVLAGNDVHIGMLALAECLVIGAGLFSDRLYVDRGVTLGNELLLAGATVGASRSELLCAAATMVTLLSIPALDPPIPSPPTATLN